jgi:hypothetical protein
MNLKIKVISDNYYTDDVEILYESVIPLVDGNVPRKHDFINYSGTLICMVENVTWNFKEKYVEVVCSPY